MNFDGLPEFLTTSDLIALGLYCSSDSAYGQRKRGTGPAYIKMGKKVLYSKANLIKFLEGSCKITSENKISLNSSIEILDFGVRARLCLIASDIKTVGELISKTENDLLKIKNFGQHTLGRVKQELDRYKLALKTNG